MHLAKMEKKLSNGNRLLKENKLGNAKTFSKVFFKKVGESYKCNFCKQPFKEDAYLKQLGDHLREFHNIPEKEFHQLFEPSKVMTIIHSTQLIDEILSGEEIPKVKISKDKIPKVESIRKSKSTSSNKERKARFLPSISHQTRLETLET